MSPHPEAARRLAPREYIRALAGSFPCLANKLETVDVAGWATIAEALKVEPPDEDGRRDGWDVDVWMALARPWSHGEKCAAAFVAHVWNPSHAASQARTLHHWRFDVIEAFGVWDLDNRAAFIAWAQNPYWP